MARQGAALASLLERELATEGARLAAIRVLDVACGIGTQALPLAARGFDVTARDVAPAAITRLRQEAQARNLTIPAAVADMRTVAGTVAARYDVVLSFDNSLPHLLTEGDIDAAFREFRKVLRPGGVCLCSVRDYDRVQRGVPLTISYGKRRRAEAVFALRQEWSWEGTTHYRIAFIIEKDSPEGPTTVVRAVTRYYAVSVARLLELMSRAGFVQCRRLDDTSYQPILIGRAA
jgi:2-polyprenyl-3-methyl-5-hydroxy-6-metoxy-1,4-benzoquinol methylase